MKSNTLILFLKTFLGFYAAILFTEAVWPVLRGQGIDWNQVLGNAGYGGAFTGLGISLLFNPKRVDWDARKIRIEMRFRAAEEFSWEKFEAYSACGGGWVFFVMKFEGRTAFQIAPAGFAPNQWREFRKFLDDRFPEKRKWIWLGPFRGL